ncbi:pilus (MSHA type) biogenesis protein MshL [Desulfopila sp. IMCC35006]|uniref:pilus (MSHA type) biogenesis protein MshL n=1 Tax=Desulfopila sp. IMCC35006 TaxID=2569542 RepID=UPI0010ABE722|nr:pilus (MSHA type) biogenesis protein MshL [Desulfopila sp. IMCC35006]TKB27015.1 pilus (MSHA type) biogenesis protein MshL [Desulfopila sp. IMCC35006]
MKYLKYCFLLSSLLLLSLLLSSCASDTRPQDQSTGMAQETAQQPTQPAKTIAPAMPASLPVRYQAASYVVDKDEKEDITIAEESKLKVGARITSTRGPQPLWDIIKRLASLKNMNVSWASDVDKNVLVDVNISANDDFYSALDNMLRQVDYYHEMQGSTIIVKYKETRQFHIAMPFIKQAYKTNTGGDVLGGSTGGQGGNTNVAGEISLSTDGVAVNQHKDGKPGGIEFNTWNSIENNLNSILNIWSTEEITSTSIQGSGKEEQNKLTANPLDPNKSLSKTDSMTNEQLASATFRRSSGGNSYFIDKPVGLITVTAPRPLLEKLEVYFKSLKKELYKQIAIEAKIIEVQLDDHSAIGLDWNTVLENLSVSSAQFSGGKSYSKVTTDDLTTAATIITDGLDRDFSGAISLASFTFDSFLHAVNQQGQTNILSNPKISVLNGQPALMTVGRNVTYIDKITSDTDGTTGTVTYTADTARALSGVGLALTANILDDNEIILNLVPVTSELEEPIEYRTIGLGEVGLPIINVREMSTTVKVKNGDMLVIGGLISNSADSSDSFIPGTRKIPFFKYLFGYEEKTSTKRELIILLKPRII